MKNKTIYSLTTIMLGVYCFLFIPLEALLQGYLESLPQTINHENGGMSIRIPYLEAQDKMWRISVALIIISIVIKFIIGKKIEDKNFKNLNTLFSIIICVMIFLLNAFTMKM